MSSRWLVLLLLSSLAFSQTSTSRAQQQPAPPSTTAAPQQSPTPAEPAPAAQAVPAPPTLAPPQVEEVTPDMPVITIVGLCDKPTPGTGEILAECKTEVTRADFEKILNALGRELPTQARQQLAVQYARLLIMEKLARDRNLVNDPQTQELVHLARLQAIAQALQRNLQEEASRSTPLEVEQYYKDHPELWDEATLQRLYIPRSSGAGKNAKPMEAAALKSLAERMRARAAAGEPFDKLQPEAWAAVGIKTEAPSTKSFAARRATFPPDQAQVFDLKPGEVSQPLEESGGYFIYKMESQQAIPLDKARPEIAQRLENEKLRHVVEGLTGSIHPSLNQAYFRAGVAPEAGAPRTGAPPVPPRQQPVRVVPPHKPPQP